MKNNDILRRIRFIFDFNDTNVIDIFKLVDVEVTREQVIGWLKKETDQKFLKCDDSQLAIFLNGFIVHRRGKKEGAAPEPAKEITNNIVFQKLKIALNLQAEDILEILELSDIHLSKHELSALFRKPGHKHYRECKDTVLHGFLNGAQIIYARDAE